MIGVSWGGIMPTCLAGFARRSFCLGPVLAGQVLEVDAGAKGGIGAGQDHAADVVALVELGHGTAQLAVQLARNGVAGLGTVQRHRGHSIGHLDQHHHVRPSRSVVAGARRPGLESLEDDQATDRAGVVE